MQHGQNSRKPWKCSFLKSWGAQPLPLRRSSRFKKKKRLFLNLSTDCLSCSLVTKTGSPVFFSIRNTCSVLNLASDFDFTDPQLKSSHLSVKSTSKSYPHLLLVTSWRLFTLNYVGALMMLWWPWGQWERMNKYLMWRVLGGGSREMLR